jgi:hypothetical protein
MRKFDVQKWVLLPDSNGSIGEHLDPWFYFRANSHSLSIGNHAGDESKDLGVQ